MEHFSIEKKLELLNQVRNQYEQNQADLLNRERIFEPSAPSEVTFSSFPLRFILALGLFLLVIYCDLSGKNFVGITANDYFSTISKDYESSINQWVDAASKKP